MNSDWRNDNDVQNAVRQLFIGVIPERSAELEGYWQDYQLRFNLLVDAGPEGLFILDAGAYRDIRFNHRAMRAFWLAGFIAWEGYCAIHEWITTGKHAFLRFDEMVDVFLRILSAKDEVLEPMPNGVPEPGIYPENNVYDRTAAELATFATGWAILHELRHIHHQNDGTSAAPDALHSEKHAEELSCDEFATRFMLEQVDAFAETEGVNANQVRLKREIGIYFALFAMTLIGAERWEGSHSHPAMQERIEAVIRHMGGNGARISDAIAHAAFGALWRRWPEAPGPFKHSLKDTL